MRMYWGDSGRMADLVRTPYALVTEEEANLFYRSINGLLTYANRTLGIFDDGRIMLDGGDRRLMDQGSVVSEALWDHRELIDAYVRTNPLGVASDQLDVIRPWTYAVHDLFTCVSASREGTFYMNADRIFSVAGVRSRPEEFVHTVPSLMLLTLLPFRGGIVTDGKVIHVSDRVKPQALTLMAEQAKSITGSCGILATADDLISYGKERHKKNQLSPQMKRWINEQLLALAPEARHS